MIAGLLGAAQPSALATAPTLRYTLPFMKAATGSGGKETARGERLQGSWPTDLGTSAKRTASHFLLVLMSRTLVAALHFPRMPSASQFIHHHDAIGQPWDVGTSPE